MKTTNPYYEGHFRDQTFQFQFAPSSECYVGEMIERLRKATAEVGVAVCGRDVLSVSIGRASYPSDGKDGEALLIEADHAMYRMKNLRDMAPR